MMLLPQIILLIEIKSKIMLPILQQYISRIYHDPLLHTHEDEERMKEQRLWMPHPSWTPNPTLNSQVNNTIIMEGQRQLQPITFMNQSQSTSIDSSTSASTNTHPEPPSSLNSTQTPDPLMKEKQCQTCLYTGVATCTGLSLYFFHLASEVNVPSVGHKAYREMTRQKRFLLGGSVTWAMVGMYRFYLG